jgi:hypothetical protein
LQDGASSTWMIVAPEAVFDFQVSPQDNCFAQKNLSE